MAATHSVPSMSGSACTDHFYHARFMRASKDARSVVLIRATGCRFEESPGGLDAATRTFDLLNACDPTAPVCPWPGGLLSQPPPRCGLSEPRCLLDCGEHWPTYCECISPDQKWACCPVADGHFEGFNGCEWPGYPVIEGNLCCPSAPPGTCDVPSRGLICACLDHHWSCSQSGIEGGGD